MDRGGAYNAGMFTSPSSLFSAARRIFSIYWQISLYIALAIVILCCRIVLFGGRIMRNVIASRAERELLSVFRTCSDIFHKILGIFLLHILKPIESLSFVRVGPSVLWLWE
jgi:hypothetical protein